MSEPINFNNLFNGVYKDKKILVTGHSGFKGTWLKFWLEKMGAIVKGISLAPYSKPSHYELLGFTDSKFIDINDYQILENEVLAFSPDLVFHLAAQPLVRYSYENPLETWQTNIIGTANVLNATRNLKNCRAIVNVTTDKCYHNNEWVWSYRENDELGGYDPYSSSKACSEILTASFRNSFYNLDNYQKTHQTLIATSRAGNVIGGGDWSTDRLIPDIIKAAVENKTVEIRSSQAVRPWQHVLEPLTAYLLLGAKLYEGSKKHATSFNIGPESNANLTVENIIQIAQKSWGDIRYKDVSNNENQLHEAGLLMLDCSKAKKMLDWKSIWSPEEAVERTINWYKNYYLNGQISTLQDLTAYITDAKSKGVNWV